MFSEDLVYQLQLLSWVSKFKTTLAGSDSPLSVAKFNKSCGSCLCFLLTFWTLHFLIQSYVGKLMMGCFDDPKAPGSVGS